MINPEELKFEKLDYQGPETLVAWAREEGWNPGPHDAKVYWATDPEGFYGYFHNGELIAGGSVVSYDGAFGFMGFFIVKPEYRSAGIGRRLWHQRRYLLRSRLQPGAAIGMDGVVAMQDFYRQGGFEIAFRDERYQRQGETFPAHPAVCALSEVDMDEVLAFDRQCFGFDRSRFLTAWLNQPESHGFGFVADGLKGFALLRKAYEGYKIGPLFANRAEVAEALYEACLNVVPGQTVFLDIPVANEAAVSLTRKYGATYVFECARMYHGTAPALPLDKIFGITSFELG